VTIQCSGVSTMRQDLLSLPSLTSFPHRATYLRRLPCRQRVSPSQTYMMPMPPQKYNCYYAASMSSLTSPDLCITFDSFRKTQAVSRRRSCRPITNKSGHWPSPSPSPSISQEAKPSCRNGWRRTGTGLGQHHTANTDDMEEAHRAPEPQLRVHPPRLQASALRETSSFPYLRLRSVCPFLPQFEPVRAPMAQPLHQTPYPIPCLSLLVGKLHG
jgi:hypothetical protein